MEMLKPPAEILHELELRALREEDQGNVPRIGCYLLPMCAILLSAGISLH